MLVPLLNLDEINDQVTLSQPITCNLTPPHYVRAETYFQLAQFRNYPSSRSFQIISHSQAEPPGS